MIYVELRRVGGNFERKFVAGWHVVALCVIRSLWVDGSNFNNVLLWYRFQSVTARGHFDEAVEDDEEFREIGGNSSANDIFLTLATDFRRGPGLGTSFSKFGSSKFCGPGVKFLIVDL